MASKKGFIGLRGVIIVGPSIEDLSTIQNILQGKGIIDFNRASEEVVIRMPGVSKKEVAETIESATGIMIEGLEELKNQPLRRWQQKRYPD